MDTPYQWTKQVASHWGGTRNGTIVSWPAGIAARGEIRNQFAHVIDVAPTVLAAAGIPEPHTVNGVTQRPYEGTAMNYSFDDANAAEEHTTQYFEMLGNRAIFHRGWTAVAKHKDPWLSSTHGLDDDVWELSRHSKRTGPSRTTSPPSILRSLPELQRLFLIRLLVSMFFRWMCGLRSRFNGELVGRPALVKGNSQTFYSGMRRMSENSVVNVKNKSFTVTAKVTLPEGGGAGVLIAQGGAYGGWSFYLTEGKPAFAYNLGGVATEYTRSDTVPPGGGARAAGAFRLQRGRSRQGRCCHPL